MGFSRRHLDFMPTNKTSEDLMTKRVCRLRSSSAWGRVMGVDIIQKTRAPLCVHTLSEEVIVVEMSSRRTCEVKRCYLVGTLTLVLLVEAIFVTI